MFHKEEISSFLKTGYCDDSLQKLLAAAQSGEVVWSHPNTCLVGRSDEGVWGGVSTVSSVPAQAYRKFEARSGWISFGRAKANKNLIPLIEAEIERRAALRRSEEGKKLTEELLKSAYQTETTEDATLHLSRQR